MMLKVSLSCMAHACSLDGRKSSILCTKPSSLPHDVGRNPVDPENQLKKTRVVSFLEES